MLGRIVEINSYHIRINPISKSSSSTTQQINASVIQKIKVLHSSAPLHRRHFREKLDERMKHFCYFLLL